MSKDDERDPMEVLAGCTFERVEPGVFFKCESAVFVVGTNSSLCYTTSAERAELLAAILNDWAALRRKVDRES